MVAKTLEKETLEMLETLGKTSVKTAIYEASVTLGLYLDNKRQNGGLPELSMKPIKIAAFVVDCLYFQTLVYIGKKGHPLEKFHQQVHQLLFEALIGDKIEVNPSSGIERLLYEGIERSFENMILKINTLFDFKYISLTLNGLAANPEQKFTHKFKHKLISCQKLFQYLAV